MIRVQLYDTNMHPTRTLVIQEGCRQEIYTGEHYMERYIEVHHIEDAPPDNNTERLSALEDAYASISRDLRSLNKE